MTKNLVRFGLAAVVLSLSLGAKGGCGGGKVTQAQTLCEKTGGSWDDSADSLVCWPPSCSESATKPCMNGKKEEVCVCPASAPFWKDGQGCWSQSQCNATCQGQAKDCTATTTCSQ